MKASPADQQQLLRLQSIDTRLQQLAHRLRSLPQTAELTALADRDAGVRTRRAEAVGALEDARTELGRIESDVEVVEKRIARDGDRLTHTSSMKDVAALESEAGRMVVSDRAAHALLGPAYQAGSVDPLNAVKLLGVATNRNRTVIQAIADKWC